MNHLEIALAEYGVSEIKGELDNPEILKYFNEIGFNGDQFKDETAWCSAFVNWACHKSNLRRSNALNARSWLNVGESVYSPRIGDVVVFWRESKDSWKGHVGFYINTVGDMIYVLGGNQGNKVCISPYHKDMLLDFRRL